MHHRYQLRVYATMENLPEVTSQLRASVNNSGLTEKVNIFSSELRFVDHGQNPAADADSRTYIKILSPIGTELFQTSDVLRRTSHQDYQAYIQRAVDVIKDNVKALS